jgi:membrane-bound lytic murein transglycosylase D
LRYLIHIFIWIFFYPAYAQSPNHGYDTIISSINQAIASQNNLGRDKVIGTHIYAEHNKAEHPVLLTPFHYEFKITQLDAATPIKLDFNKEVQNFIELYITKRWSELPEIIGLSTYYFPLVEEVIDTYNLPHELKYLVFVESGFDPLAISSSGAVGLWQFKLNSGKMFDLRINSYIDERRDPVKSTEAACKYLGYLYNTFHDWQLAIAAFNGGPGEVRNAIQRSGGKTNFWELTPYLAEQTKNYLPAFIAALYVFNNYSEHGINPTQPAFRPLETEKVTINQQVQFSQIARYINITTEALQWLNPKYKLDVVPDSPSGMEVVLPRKLVPAFIASENQIYSMPIIDDDYHSVLAKGENTEGKNLIYHVVEKGEFFHLIAIKYECTIENIKSWNNLDSHFLYPGQKLKIWINKND